VYFDTVHRIVLHFQEHRIANEADAPQWEETVKSIMQSSLKLFKRYFTYAESEVMWVLE
jgi:hypothetical protein